MHLRCANEKLKEERNSYRMTPCMVFGFCGNKDFEIEQKGNDDETTKIYIVSSE